METRFTPLLATNYAPSKAEVDEIRKLLVDPVNQLNQFDTEINHLHRVLNELTSKRNQLHAQIISHKNLIAPLRRIPQELLQEIFIHCLPTDHNAAMSCHEPPLLLGRVCSRWRSVALSTPRLWSGIHIVIGSIPSQEGLESVDQIPDVHAAVEEWLGRSGGLPLSISLFQAPYTITNQEYVDNLISTLVQFSSRWRNMSLLLSSQPPSLLFSLSHQTFPLLERFSFHGVTADSPSPFPELAPLDIFRAPRIKSTSSHHLGTLPKNMGWSQLTFLSLESCGYGEGRLTPSKAIEILHESPGLIHCEFNFISGWNSPSSIDHEIVTMPSLVTLAIFEGTISLKPFFEHLRLPVLASLEFAATPRRHPHPDDPEEPSICTLLSRIDSLKELTLSSLNLTHTTLVNCLQRASSITRLSVLNPQPADSWPFFIATLSPFTDDVVSLLTPTEDQPPMCPLLRVLECNPCNASDTALLTLIKQRSTYASKYDIQPLERVDLEFHRQRSMDIRSKLPPKALVETAITLKYRTPPDVPRISLRAGLERPGRLQIPSNTYRHLHR
ncbi:hypothetical protein BDZ94DRAFT_1261564 [Collybia nuda]|uniref:F-box domain-containing protein n=1 Tax=Collybia nuda TaxID=64659 RepID=A0A9P5Y2M7_9AGAR|nr:hypothetical protein BDZ94DRAFT_1261564 [Collybia nuda]